MRALVLFLSAFLIGARLPEPGPTNAHIQTVEYRPDEVVELQGAMGWQISLEFGTDERIETVSIGDALAWQVTPNKRARNLFLKPLVKNASTNMTVVTDKRRYAFSMTTAPRLSTTPWVVTFTYPPEIVETIEEAPPPPPRPINGNYRMGGDQGLLPVRVWDDGILTYFEFVDGMPLPAIFADGPGKDETLVNSQTRGRIVVVQQTSGRFTLRSGKSVGTVTYVGGPRT